MIIKMIRRLLLAILLLFGISTGFAQTGIYFMNHYNPAEYNFDNSNYQLSQDKRGVIHVANRHGVLHYDGNNWWLTNVPYTVYCLADYNNKIYVGGREGFGFIYKTGANRKYTPIDTLHRDILRVVIKKEKVYYLTEKNLYVVNINDTGEIREIASNNLEMLDLVDVEENIYLSTSRGLYSVQPDETIIPVDYGPEGAYFIRKSNSNRILYVTDSSHFYTQHQGKLTKLNFKNQTFLEDHTITEVIWASDSLIAVSTLSAGVVFIDAYTGETVQVIDYDSGLPDNEIYNIYLDQSGAVWASHSYGFTVISPEIPLRSFEHYPGLKGSIECILPFNNTLYVGTSLGVYRLIARKQMSQKVIYDRVRVRVESEEVVVEEKKQKWRLFKKKAKQQEKARDKTEVAPEYRYVYKKRIVEEEISRSYEFDKIGGINAKSIRLMEFSGRLLAGTVQGLFEIEEDTAIQILRTPVLSMFGLPEKNLAFISTVDEEVHVLAIYRGEWEDTQMLAGLSDYIDQSTLDPEGNVWLCGADSLYRIGLDGRELVDVEVYHIENPHFDKVYSVNYRNKILFINSSGYYAYDNLKIVRQDSIAKSIGLPHRFILSADGELLVNTGSDWYGAGDNIRNSLNFLSFFKDPKAVARDRGYDYWVATATNDLYKIDILEASKLSERGDIYLKEVRSNERRIPIVPEMSVNYDVNQLTFEFASPDYSGIYRKEYRFRLTNASGTQSPWSNWSEGNNVVSYQFLPAGIYTLEASYRNSLGKVVNAKPFKFKIKAPYWQQAWFYVLEVVFFGGLLIFSFYLNRGKGRYGFISRLLGFLTLILIVEFFQTVAEYYYEAENSPVINFFIQAFIALLILPVEGILRRYLTRSPDQDEIPALSNKGNKD